MRHYLRCDDLIDGVSHREPQVHLLGKDGHAAEGNEIQRDAAPTRAAAGGDVTQGMVKRTSPFTSVSR